MRILFVTLNAYGMLSGGYSGNIGGAELQQVVIAKELAARGHEVYFLEESRENKREGVVDGVHVVLKEFEDDTVTGHVAGLAERTLPTRVLKRLGETWSFLRKIRPDICYRRVPNFELFPLVAYCHLTSTPLVYGFAHDSELTDNPLVFDHPLTDNPYYWRSVRAAIGLADVQIAQNEFQEMEAKRQFDGRVERILNGYPLPTDRADKHGDDPDGAPVVLWVATIRSWKRPELVLKVAESIPQAEFVMVGGPSNTEPELFDSIRDSAAELPNVRFEGFVPHEQLQEHYLKADLFLNTSDYEGFPNTFLEAWSMHTPTLSLNVNPDSILIDRKVGYYADGSVDALCARLETLVEDDNRRQRLGESAFEYFAENHSIGHVADRYESLFAELTHTT